jgi:heat shock protein beta
VGWSQQSSRNSRLQPLTPLYSAVAEETFEFTAETDRVMEIIINSLYSDKDVFLRELVSNAADACDKKRFLSIEAGGASDALRVRITADLEKKTLTIEDTGVGMSRDELVANLGKIAKSGTKAFAEALGDGAPDDVNLIGQFGVGFYSGYLVADKMTVTTKSMNSDKTHTWSSDAKSNFTVREEGDIDGSSGTRITLDIKEDCSEYLEEATLRRLLKRYSEFLQFPIELNASKTTYDTEVDEEATKKAREEDPEAAEVTKSVTNKSFDYEVVNSMKPVWLRPPKEVTEEEHSEFYKSAFRAFEDPLRTIHFSLEGQVQFKALLYVPKKLPFELNQNMFDENANSMKLYVKRVFINDKFDLLPRWLVFMRGIVDSEDLPLNVGREILQKSKMLGVIQRRLVKKSLDAFSELQKDAAEYSDFWKNFGKYIKVGAVEETGDVQKDLAKLCRFYSTKSGEDQTTFAEYIERMPENASKILYLSGDSREQALNSPVIQRLIKTDYEVLLLPEALDEIVCQAIGEVDGKKLVDASKDDLKDVFEDEDEDADNGDFEELCSWLKLQLEDRVSSVKLSNRLVDAPAALVEGAFGMSPMMRKYMAAQAVAQEDEFAGFGGAGKPTLELNAKSPIVVALNNGDFTSDEAEDAAELLFDVAALTGGYELTDAASFAGKVTKLMGATEIPPKKEEPPKEEEEEEEDEDEPPKEVEVVE